MSKNLPPRYFVIHASATFPSMDVGAEWIRNIHVNQNGWNDIGYHYVIRRDGTIEKGRPEDVVGAHTSGHNTRTIGICLIGGLKEGTRLPEDNFTNDQWRSLDALLDGLHIKYPEATIRGHNGFSGHHSRGCPCFDWQTYAKSVEYRWDLADTTHDDEDFYQEREFGSNVVPDKPVSSFEERVVEVENKPSTMGRLFSFFKR